jgi:hypothetical protein
MKLKKELYLLIRDRGLHNKWKHAFAMPERTKLLREFRNDYEKQKKPQLDEQELEEIEIIVIESLHSAYAIKIILWENGYFFDVIGTVNKIDMLQKRIMIQTDLENRAVDINKIVAVRRL